MKKQMMLIGLGLSLMLAACDNRNSSTQQPYYPPVEDFDNEFQNAPDCNDRVITTYNRVINQANRYIWSGEIRTLRNLVSSCGQLRSLLRGSSCVATDLATGDLILASYSDLQEACDQAQYELRMYDNDPRGYSMKPGQERQRSYNLGKMQDSDGIGQRPRSQGGPRGRAPVNPPSGPEGR